MRKAITIVFSALAAAALGQSNYSLTIDANLNRKPINPLIYGVAFGSQAQLTDLHSTLNRMGGNNQSRYNWNLNADNRDNDWYFESIADANATPGYRADSFIQGNKAAGAQTMMTIPMIGWVAKLGANRSTIGSFSIAKYGAQTASDPWNTDCGNGISTAAGNPFITGNDPNDANVPSDVAFQEQWINHLVSKWGPASNGGLKYYLMDNEVSIWYSTHRDVHPNGPTMDEILNDILAYGHAVKSYDPSALVVGPEEWGWGGYLYSGSDQQYAAAHNYNGVYPDRAAHGNIDYVAYLLNGIHAADVKSGKRTLDVFSLHYYPADGSFTNDASAANQIIRNRTTRTLWDPNYIDPDWINANVQLIPRMKNWVNTCYPGTQTAITEYNLGAESNINGATAQADILGIFGWQGLDIATRWTTPAASTPTYKAMKMYTNYDGKGSGFGDTSISDTGNNNPDNLSSFAAIRSKDGALTLMVINKVASSAAISATLNNFKGNGTVNVWQLTASNAITQPIGFMLSNGVLNTTVPGQSVTLFVLAPSTQKIVIPAVPTGVSARGLNKQVAVSWPPCTGSTSYLIWRSTDGTTFNRYTRVSTNSFTDGNLINGKTYWYEISSTDQAGNSAPSAAVSAIPSAPTPDPSQYNFENSAQGWTTSGGMIGEVFPNYGEHYLGQEGLAVQINATGSDTQEAYVSSPPTPAGKTVTFHVFIPAGCKLSWIQPYVMQGASGNWTWTGNYTPLSSLTLGAWNTLTIQVPANAVTPLYSMGVQFSASVPWSGYCFIDSVSW